MSPFDEGVMRRARALKIADIALAAFEAECELLLAVWDRDLNAGGIEVVRDRLRRIREGKP